MLITLIIASIDWSFNTMSLIGKNMTISIHESSLAILRFENSRPGSRVLAPIDTPIHFFNSYELFVHCTCAHDHSPIQHE